MGFCSLGASLLSKGLANISSVRIVIFGILDFCKMSLELWVAFQAEI